jgi:hypothetical protein
MGIGPRRAAASVVTFLAPSACCRRFVVLPYPGLAFPDPHRGARPADPSEPPAQHRHATRRGRSRGTHSACQVNLPAHRDGNRTVAFPGTQIHADQGPAFLLKQDGGVWGQRLEVVSASADRAAALRRMTGTSSLEFKPRPRSSCPHR